MASTAKPKTEKKSTAETVAELEELSTPTEAEIAHDEQLSTDELLADLPPLKDATKLRLRERNRLLALVLRSQAIGDDGALDTEGREAQIAILELMSGVDEFAESIAVDPDAYVEWSEGRGYEAFLAILDRYSVALGK